MQQCAQVLVWSIADHVTTLTATGKMHNAVKGERLQHRTKLEVQARPATLRYRFGRQLACWPSPAEGSAHMAVASDCQVKCTAGMSMPWVH